MFLQSSCAAVLVPVPQKLPLLRKRMLRMSWVRMRSWEKTLIPCGWCSYTEGCFKWCRQTSRQENSMGVLLHSQLHLEAGRGLGQVLPWVFNGNMALLALHLQLVFRTEKRHFCCLRPCVWGSVKAPLTNETRGAHSSAECTVALSFLFLRTALPPGLSLSEEIAPCPWNDTRNITFWI